MTQEVRKTFLESLLIFLAGLPGALNEMLKVCGDNIPFVGRFLQPAVWTMIGMMIVQWGMEGVGLGGVIPGLWHGLLSTLGAVLDLIPGVTFTGDAVALPPVDAVGTASGAASSSTEIPPGT